MTMKNTLHGKEIMVLLCHGDKEYRCTIRSGCCGQHPFEAVDHCSGRVVHSFSAQDAKKLREKGCTPNMMLV